LTTSEGVNREAFSAWDWALFVSVSLIWGSSFLLMAIGLDAFEPGLITVLRVALGAGALWLVPKARATSVQRADWPRLVALSFLWVAIPFTLFPIAQQYINSAIAGMLNGAMPIFAAVFAVILLRRLPRRTMIVGLVIGFVGVVAISAPSIGQGSSEALGVVLVLLATVCYGISVNIAAPIQQQYGSIPVMARMLALATVWTAPLGLIGAAGSEFAWGPFVAVATAGVLGTGIAFVIMGSLVGRVGATRASFITYVIPVVALVLGVVFRGDEVAPIAVVGVVLVIAGAALASRRDT
jgi:drug/metabolite transporter (DMT)-like permease